MYKFVYLLKMVFWAALAIGFLAKCSQESSRDTDLLQADAYLDVAEVYLEQGQFRAAAIEAQNALQLAPGYQRGIKLLSETNLEVGNLADTIVILEDQIQNLADNSEETILLADAYLRSGNWAQTINLLSSRQFQDSTISARALILLGNAYAGAGDLQLAEQSFQQTLEIDERNVEALIGLSKIAYQDEDVNRSSEYLNQAIAIDPTHLDLWIWRGSFAMLNSDYPNAEEAYFEALQLMSNYDIITAKRFAVLQSILIPLQMQQKNDEALRYSEIIASSPQGQIQNAYTRALSLYEQQNFERAELAINQVLDIRADHLEGNLLLGMIKYGLQDYDQASTILADYAPLVTSSSLPIRILAASYLSLGQAENALSALQGADDYFVDEPAFYAALGTTFRILENHQEAITAFETARSLGSEEPEILYSLAGTYYTIGDEQSAIAVLNDAIAQNPDSTVGANALLSLYLDQGDIESANSQVQNLLRANPDSSELQILAGQVAMYSGDSNLARQYFDAGLELDESNNSARLNLARLALVDQDYQLAADNFNAVLDRDPTNVDALRGSLVLGRLSNTEAQRLQRISNIVDQYPDSSSAPMILAQYYLQIDSLEQALQYAQISLDREQNSEARSTMVAALNAQADAQNQAGNYQLALETLDQALEIPENNVQSLSLASTIAIQNSDFERASTYIERLESLEGESATVLEIKADVLVARQDIDTALQLYRQAWDLAISPGLGTKLYGLINATEGSASGKILLDEWYEALPEDGSVNTFLGIYYQTNNQSEDSISYYESALDYQPNRVVVLNNLAWLYQDSNPQRAQELSARANELLPDNPDIMDTYGWILFKQGNVDEATEILERASQLAPESELIREHLNAVQQ